MNIQVETPYREDGPLNKENGLLQNAGLGRAFTPQVQAPNMRMYSKTVQVAAEEDVVVPEEAKAAFFALLQARGDIDFEALLNGGANGGLSWHQSVPEDDIVLGAALGAEGAEDMTLEELLADMDDVFSAEAVNRVLDQVFGGDSSPLDFDQYIDALAALYASYQSVAAQYLTGAEYDAAVEVLEDSFGRYMDKLVDQVLACDKYMTDPDGVEESLRTMYAERVDYYGELLSDDAFSTGVEGTENASADRDPYFVATRLRQYADSQGAGLGRESEVEYTSGDIKAMLLMHVVSLPADHAYTQELLDCLLAMDRTQLDTVLQNMDGLSDAGRKALEDAYRRVALEANTQFSRNLDEWTEEISPARKDVEEILIARVPEQRVDKSAVEAMIGSMLRSTAFDSLEAGLYAVLQGLDGELAGENANVTVNPDGALGRLIGLRRADAVRTDGAGRETISELVRAFLVSYSYVCKYVEADVEGQATGSQVDIIA